MIGRARRILFNAFAVITLGVAIAVGVLWARSYRSYPWLSQTTASWSLQGGLPRGTVEVIFATEDVSVFGRGFDANLFPVRNRPSRGAWRSLFPGFHFEHRRISMLIDGETNQPLSYTREWIVKVPCWAIVIACVMPTLVCARRWWLRRRASSAGSAPCVTCGYDLRATPGRCPECGTVAAPFGV